MGPGLPARSPGAEGWQISNPPIVQMAALRASLDIFDEAGMPRLREKSCPAHRISRVSFERDRATTEFRHYPGRPRRTAAASSRCASSDADKSLFEAITAAGVFADWREPDVIRVAPAAL